MTARATPLQQLIVSTCESKGWRQKDLHHAIAERGLTVTLQAVCAWWKGGGVRDAHRSVLADALGLGLDDLLRAAAGHTPREEAAS